MLSYFKDKIKLSDKQVVPTQKNKNLIIISFRFLLKISKFEIESEKIVLNDYEFNVFDCFKISCKFDLMKKYDDFEIV